MHRSLQADAVGKDAAPRPPPRARCQPRPGNRPSVQTPRSGGTRCHQPHTRPSRFTPETGRPLLSPTSHCVSCWFAFEFCSVPLVPGVSVCLLFEALRRRVGWGLDFLSCAWFGGVFLAGTMCPASLPHPVLGGAGQPRCRGVCGVSGGWGPGGRIVSPCRLPSRPSCLQAARPSPSSWAVWGRCPFPVVLLGSRQHVCVPVWRVLRFRAAPLTAGCVPSPDGLLSSESHRGPLRAVEPVSASGCRKQSSVLSPLPAQEGAWSPPPRTLPPVCCTAVPADWSLLLSTCARNVGLVVPRRILGREWGSPRVGEWGAQARTPQPGLWGRSARPAHRDPAGRQRGGGGGDGGVRAGGAPGACRAPWGPGGAEAGSPAVL